jgi:hypothetical protein
MGLIPNRTEMQTFQYQVVLYGNTSCKARFKTGQLTINRYVVDFTITVIMKTLLGDDNGDRAERLSISVTPLVHRKTKLQKNMLQTEVGNTVA